MQDCKRRQEQEQKGGGSSRREEGHGSAGDRCQKECQRHSHEYERKQCVRDCERRQRGGGGSGAGGRGREGDERQHAWETVAGAILQVV